MIWSIDPSMHDLRFGGTCLYKASNIGCYLGNDGEIERLRFIDLMKARPIKNHDEVKRDVDTFKRHMKDNIELRGK